VEFQSKTILYFTESQTLKKIIEYSLEDCSAHIEEGSKQIPKIKEPWALIIFDGNLLSRSEGEQWERFLHEASCPVLLLDSGLEPQNPLLKTSTPKRLVLRKPFERETFIRGIKTLGFPFFFEGKQNITTKGPEPRLEGAVVLPLAFQEELKKEALAFVSDYCKSHFQSIAEEVLLKEIHRLTEERNSFLDEA
jgi:hypothetical protein